MMDGFCLVTGAGGGIGKSVVRRLAADGFRILAADITEEKAAGALLQASGAGHQTIALDVTSEEAVSRTFSLYQIDQVVSAAGVLLFAPGGERPRIVDISLHDWELTHRVNLTGTFLVARAYLREADRRSIPHGRFVGFSSVAAQLGGFRSSSAYISSKAAILGFIKAAAREAAHLGITFNAVAPGLIDAPMLHQSLRPENYGLVSDSIPLKRIGSPDEVAAAVAFLMSRDASYITGAVIDVNGGYRMQ